MLKTYIHQRLMQNFSNPIVQAWMENCAFASHNQPALKEHTASNAPSLSQTQNTTSRILSTLSSLTRPHNVQTVCDTNDHEQYKSIIIENKTPPNIAFEYIADAIENKLDLMCEDVESYIERDPALFQHYELALLPNAPCMATLLHRIAHEIWSWSKRTDSRSLAMSISHYSRVSTGAEIHPAAKIGRNFVLDHATGTVIGATCEIGNNCYILNNVILGARGICSNERAKRHPTICDNVEIGSSVRILGNITVGQDCFICPATTITKDVPAYSNVKPDGNNGFVCTARNAAQNYKPTELLNAI